MPTPKILQELKLTSLHYDTRMSAVKAWFNIFKGFMKETPSAEDMAPIIALVHQEKSGKWAIRMDCENLFLGDGTAYIERAPSRSPMMTRSQDMMLPLVIYRNLSVPMHIIDAESDNDLYLVSDQNSELKHSIPI